MTYHESLKIDVLVGKKIYNAWINEEKDLVILGTDEGYYWLTWTGDCCARCYLAHVNNPEALVNAKITEVTNSEWIEDTSSTEDALVDTMGTQIVTTKGHITFESRLENGSYHYSGELNISDHGPLGQYQSFNNDENFPIMKKLYEF